MNHKDMYMLGSKTENVHSAKKL